MGAGGEIVKVITDKDRKISHRAGLVLIAMVGVILLNNILGFSSHYTMENKLEDLKKVNEIITNKNSDSITIQYAKDLRIEIINRQDFFSYLFSRSSSRSKKNPIINNPATIPKPIDSPIRNNFLFFLSTSGGFVLATILVFWINLFGKTKADYLSDRLGISLYYTLLFLAFGFISYALLDLMPMLGETWNLNYMVNTIIHLGFIILSFRLYLYIQNQDNKQKMKELEAENAKLAEELNQKPPLS